MPDLAALTLVTRPVKRSDLEYPTENVTFGYLAVIDKLLYTAYRWDSGGVVVADVFIDKAVEGVVNPIYWPFMLARHQDADNTYYNWLSRYMRTSDHQLYKAVNYVETQLAVESVDIEDTGHIFAISCSGSVVKSLRYRLDRPARSITEVTPSGVITATDTTFVSGYFGFRIIESWNDQGYVDTASARLLPPLTRVPLASHVIEYNITGTGTRDDPIRPDMPQELVEVSQSQVTPNEWQAIKNNPKGPNGLPQVDRLAVTWGAIDYKGEPTMVVTVYGGSPSYLRPDRIQKHMEHARRKNLLAETIKPDPQYVRDLHRRLRKDRKDMMITENELMYQLLGYEELEVEAVADFYERELVNLNRIKNVPAWELERTLERWERLAEKHKRPNALVKLRRVRRR